MVIDELPIGSTVRFGRYALGNRPELIDIDWIKADTDNSMISEKVLFGMKYDETEDFGRQNYDYNQSNIRQMINSDNLSWYRPTHPRDRSNNYVHFEVFYENVGAYKGFLYHFSEEELLLIDPYGIDYMRLPTVSEINGGFRYFKKHGKRAKPVPQFGGISIAGYHGGSFSPYYMLGDKPDELFELTRSGSVKAKMPNFPSGVRPVFKLKPNSEVIQVDENTYQISLSLNVPTRFFNSTKSLDWLLGSE